MLKIKDLKRLREIVTILFEEGFEALLAEARLKRHLPLSKRFKKVEKKDPMAVRARKALERLGPTFVKFGQLLSLRPDLIPAEYVKEFEQMQDEVPPFPYSEVKKVIESELKRPIKKLFKEFDSKPVAAASVGQVHKAKLPNGKTVAVKVQRPGITEIMQEDIDILYVIAELLQKHVKALKDFDVVGVVKEVERYTKDELNYRVEALNAKIIGENFEGNKKVIIPKIYDDYTTQKVLTMQFIDGKPLSQVKKAMTSHLNMVYKLMIDQIYDHGCFHADPHPANIFISGGKVAFIDFGIVGKLDEDLKEKALDLFMAVADDDVNKVVKTFLAMGFAKDIDEASFKHEIGELIMELQRSRLKDVRVGVIIEQMMQAALKYRIKLPLNFVLFAKAIVTLEGLGLRYNPNFKLLEQSKPLLAKIIRKRYSPKRVLKKSMKTALDYKELMEKLPEDLSEILDSVKTGKIGIDVEDTDIKNLSAEMEKSSGYIGIGLITSAIVVASAFMTTVEQQIYIRGVAVVPALGFSVAVLLSIWLIQKTIFSKFVRNLRGE